MDRKLAVLSAVVIGLLAAPLLVTQLSGKVEKRDQESVQDPATPPPVPPPPLMTRDQFFQIQQGMTYAQCVEIIGVVGESVDPSQQGAAGVQSAFRWTDASGATEFILGFRDGRLASRSMNMSASARTKAQARLRAEKARQTAMGPAEVQKLEDAARRDGAPIVITLSEFNRLQIGMTYDQCIAIIGAENPMAIPYAPQRNAILTGQAPGQRLSEAYMWSNPGGYFAEISFANGRMTGKTWKKTSGATGGGRASGSGGSGR